MLKKEDGLGECGGWDWRVENGYLYYRPHVIYSTWKDNDRPYTAVPVDFLVALAQEGALDYDGMKSFGGWFSDE